MKSLILIFAAICYGQNQPASSVVTQVLVNSTTATTANVQNLGQIQHFVYANVTQGGGTCSAAQSIYLQGSVNKADWINIGPVIALNYGTGPLNGQTSGNGLFPALRIFVNGGSSTCKLNAWYIGTVSAYANPQTVLNSSNYTVASVATQASAGGTATVIVVPPVGTATAIPVVYGIISSQPDAANTYAYVLRSAGSDCTGPNGASLTWRMGTAGGPNFILPTSVVPYLIGAAGNSLCITGTSAAGTTNGTITLIMRFEGGS